MTLSLRLVISMQTNMTLASMAPEELLHTSQTHPDMLLDDLL